jgi:hypothetical protein
MSSNILDKISYTLFLDSDDKVSGTNNNATFNINWVAFLPMKYSYYKVIFNFQTVGGYYKDGGVGIFSNARIYTNLQGNTFSYDSTTNSGTKLLGFIKRDLQNTQSTINTFSSSLYDNASKTIVLPSSNLFTVSIYNNYSNVLLLDTSADGTAFAGDMGSWLAMLEFIPISDSITM